MVADYAELARFGNVSRARISQIMNPLHFSGLFRSRRLTEEELQQFRRMIRDAEKKPRKWKAKQG